MSEQNETLYAIQYIDERGKKWFEGVTNNFDAWLKDHNEDRLRHGISEEAADDFDVEEVEVSYFDGVSDA
jgi:hypothetical protein